MKSFLPAVLTAAALLVAPAVRAAFPNVSLSMPSTVNTNETFTVTVTGTDSDGDLNSMGLRWQGFGLQNSWTISGFLSSQNQSLTAPSSPTTMNLRGEVFDNASNGTTGAWIPVSVVQNTTPLVSLTGPTTRTTGQSGTWNFSTWESANPNLKRWRFYFSTNPGAGWTNIPVTGSSGSYTTSFATVGSYTMIVEAEDNSGASASTSLTVVVSAPPPSPPVITSSTSASGTYGSSFSYSITATNSPTSYGATGLPSGLSVNTSAGLISGTPAAAGSFSVGLSATNAGGTGTATLSLTINQANQTISFGTLANKVTSDPPFGVSASASSGLAVTFSVLSGPATISGTTVTLTGGTGTVTIRAAQAGNSNYNAAPVVDRSFTVSTPGPVSDTANQNQLKVHLPTSL